MNDRPACTQCNACRLQMEISAKGWEAYCTAAGNGKRGRLIMWQFGHGLAWAKKELIDRLNTKICPAWCPAWERGEKA